MVMTMTMAAHQLQEALAMLRFREEEEEWKGGWGGREVHTVV
jgi:hypothetical protein